jgi:hypothetical protein
VISRVSLSIGPTVLEVRMWQHEAELE